MGGTWCCFFLGKIPKKSPSFTEILVSSLCFLKFLNNHSLIKFDSKTYLLTYLSWLNYIYFIKMAELPLELKKKKKPLAVEVTGGAKTLSLLNFPSLTDKMPFSTTGEQEEKLISNTAIFYSNHTLTIPNHRLPKSEPKQSHILQQKALSF